DVGFEVDSSILKKFFSHWGETKYFESLDWLEVGVKLRILRRGGTALTQGIPESIHREIVECLSAHQRALRLREICAALGVDDLPLDPRALGPGKIMAYAPSQRFLAREDSFYVLQNWVEDETHKKNRIASERVITPRAWKSCHVSADQLWKAIEEDQ